MELTVQNVYGLLLRSKLLSLDEAKAMYARWQAEARDAAGNLARFAGWVVSNKYLTEYQASLLARGHAEGFFLNEYKILDRLGKGRMAGVYKAQHQLGQTVAIKVLPPSKARESNLLARFKREAGLALRLKHPNIVRSFQTGTAAGLHYLVMEYLEGETLEDVLARRGKLPPPEAVRLIHQALQGLQHIHAQGLVHRDLKPSNLMLVGAAGPDSTARSTVKILDIGLGRALFDERTPDLGSHPGLTGEGVLLGTPDYMSPEQARDAHTTDIRSDIYSLGCVLYHALAGQPPFPDTNIISQMIRHATEPARPLKDFNPGVPDGLQQIVNWMTAKDPGGRYPSPERAAQALQVFLAAGSETPAAPEADPKMRPYLTWLEVESVKNAHPAQAEAAPTAPTMVPAALPAPGGPRGAETAGRQPPPAPAPPRAKPPRPDKPGQSDKEAKPVKAERPAASSGAGAQAPAAPHGKRRSKKHRRAHHAPSAVPVAGPEEVNVELVVLPPPGQAGKKVLGVRLSRRDYIAFCLGAGAGAGVAFLGYLLARVGAGLMK